MPLYHLSVKTISRANGRSATAAAAYRAGVAIVDVRTGEVHDYTRRSGVASVEITVPPEAPAWARDRSLLWNAAEQAETRKNSTVAREFEVALPDELDGMQRHALVRAFAEELTVRHGVAVDACIHLPDKDGDKRNHHAHILTSTRRLGASGFSEKARELDSQQTGPALVVQWRERWGELTNLALEQAGSLARVDHRRLEVQRAAALERGAVDQADGLDRTPTAHLGPVPSADLRRAQAAGRVPVTERARQHGEILAENRERRSLLERARALGDVVREAVTLGMTAFRERFEDVREGMAQFQARAQAWAQQQAEEVRLREAEARAVGRKPDRGLER